LSIEYINTINLTLHYAIMTSKLYLMYIVIMNISTIKTPNSDKLMSIYSPLSVFIILFTIVYIIAELNFIILFDKDLFLYYYEFMAMLDQIIFTILIAKNFKKG